MTCASFDEVLGRNHEATAAFMRRDTQPFRTSFRGRTTPPLQTRSAASHVASSEISPRLDRAATYYSNGEVIGTQTISTHHSDDLGSSRSSTCVVALAVATSWTMSACA